MHQVHGSATHAEAGKEAGPAEARPRTSRGLDTAGDFGINAKKKCGGENPRKIKPIFEGLINLLPRSVKTPASTPPDPARPRA